MSSTLDYTSPHAAQDVTPEMLALAESIYDGWYADQDTIEWDDFLDRMDGTTLADESTLNLGEDMLSPAIEKIKRHIRKYRNQ